MKEEEKIYNLMKCLDISREEAIQVIADDKRIEKGEKLFELSAEQKKVAKKMTITTSGKKVDAYGKTSTKIKKVDTDKINIVNSIIDALNHLQVNDLEVNNPERELNFKLNGKKFKVVLSAPRK